MLSDMVKKSKAINSLSLQKLGFLLLVIDELVPTVNIRSSVSALCSISFGLQIYILSSKVLLIYSYNNVNKQEEMTVLGNKV